MTGYGLGILFRCVTTGRCKGYINTLKVIVMFQLTNGYLLASEGVCRSGTSRRTKQQQLVGLENFNTGSGQDFSEIFSGCSSLQELNLSTFDTRNADYAYLSEGQYENWMFLSFMSGCSGLKKVTFGPYFSFDGNGNCPGGYKFGMPAASAVEGWDGNWYDADGNAYAPSAIPEQTAATYYAVNPVNP